MYLEHSDTLGQARATCDLIRENIAKNSRLAASLRRLDHIPVLQANWNDKATNIQAIANELSPGLDAIVFLDGNPVDAHELFI